MTRSAQVSTTPQDIAPPRGGRCHEERPGHERSTRAPGATSAPSTCATRPARWPSAPPGNPPAAASTPRSRSRTWTAPPLLDTSSSRCAPTRPRASPAMRITISVGEQLNQPPEASHARVALSAGRVNPLRRSASRRSTLRCRGPAPSLTACEGTSVTSLAGGDKADGPTDGPARERRWLTAAGAVPQPTSTAARTFSATRRLVKRSHASEPGYRLRNIKFA